MTVICGVASCNRPAIVFGRALCRRHYRRWQRHGDPQAGRIAVGSPIPERLERYLERDGLFGCWLWTGATNGAYGELTVGGRSQKAHRLMYEVAVGPIPDGYEIDHLCRNKACVNPSHLEAVTKAENVRRGWPFRADYRGAA